MTTDVLAHSVKIRPGLPSDIEPCARILFNAFGAIAAHHNFPPDIPSIEVGTELITMLLTHSHFFSVVAEVDGKIVGSNFLDERSGIAGVLVRLTAAPPFTGMVQMSLPRMNASRPPSRDQNGSISSPAV